MASRYSRIPEIKIDGKRVYRTVEYPSIPLSEGDLYVYTTAGDRYDTLALQAYGNSSYWWIISVANPQLGSFDSLIPPLGSQVRIPTNPLDIINQFYSLNS
jgi:hypothetical protein